MDEGGALYLAFDRLAEVVADEAGADTALRLRRDFSARRGEVFDDEPMWELASNSFLEWFVLESCNSGEVAPRGVAAALRIAEGDERQRMRAWLHSHRSLFVVAAVRGARISLRDLLGGGAFAVTESRAHHGLGAGDVIEARVVAWDEHLVFGRGFVFHPAAAADDIKRACERPFSDRAARHAWLDRLASLRVKCERYRHRGAVDVYRRGLAA